jgi:hypothetical protein
MAVAGSVSIANIGPIIFSDDVNRQITFLRQNGLLAQAMTCTRCNIAMRIGLKRDISDGEIFRLVTACYLSIQYVYVVLTMYCYTN